MAYIPSYPALRNHRKTGRLMRTLNIPRPAAIGHLHALWWWCLDNAPHGDLSGVDAEDIAEGGLWEGEPYTFLHALVSSGFVDESGFVHDWGEYAGRLLVASEKDVERVRRWREQQDATGNETGNETRNETGNEPVTYGNDTVTLRNAEKSGIVLDSPYPLDLRPSQGIGNSPPPIVPPPAKRNETRTLRVTDGGFQRFWQVYPRKTAKKDAERAWEKLRPDDALVETMLTAIAAQRESEQWQRNGGAYIPYPGTWLNGRRWEDELPTFGGLTAPGSQATNGARKESATLATAQRFIARHRKDATDG